MCYGLNMDKKDKIKYWLITSEKDWEVARHLVEKGDLSYALFFGHLSIEKICKAVFVDRHDTTPPFSHNLVYLSEKCGLELNEYYIELLEEISDFNLEARYPDHKLSFIKKCTVEFTKIKMAQIEEIKIWLLQNIHL